MAQKNNPSDTDQFSVREYQPSDRQAVMSLFRDGVIENIYPAFFKAMRHPDHVGVALGISMAGYVLGGSSYFQAIVFGGAWAGLIYFCCYEIYQGYLSRRLSADMADIQAAYLDDPGNGFWVAEAGGGDQPRVVGILALLGKQGREGEEQEGGENDDRNGLMTRGGGGGSYGEIAHAVVSFQWRRKGLGSQLARRALDFCKERGYSRMVLDVSSPQRAALPFCRNLGFIQTASHSNTHANRWYSRLARINVMRMEKLV